MIAKDFFLDIKNDIIAQLKQDNINVRTAAISFNLLMATFPFIIFLFTLIPYIPLQNVESTFMAFLNELLPETAYVFIQNTILDIVGIQRGGLLSFVLIFAIFSASNGVFMITLAFEKDTSIFKQRSWLRKRLVSLFVTLFLSIILCILLMCFIGIEILMQHVKHNFDLENNTIVTIFKLVRMIFTILLFLNVFSLIYTFVPATHHKWFYLSPGSFFATLLSIIASSGFSFYVNNLGQYNTIYGSIGTIIVVMLWLYINAYVLLLGFELNSAYYRVKERYLIAKK